MWNVSDFLQSLFSDLRKKGFTKDGKYRNDVYRTFYALFDPGQTSTNNTNVFLIPTYAVIVAYILATKTTLFGKKLDPNWGSLCNNEDVVYIAHLLAKNWGIFVNNAFRKVDVMS